MKESQLAWSHRSVEDVCSMESTREYGMTHNNTKYKSRGLRDGNQLYTRVHTDTVRKPAVRNCATETGGIIRN